jgi:membrane-bound lytic murein transglycosylase B
MASTGRPRRCGQSIALPWRLFGRDCCILVTLCRFGVGLPRYSWQKHNMKLSNLNSLRNKLRTATGCIAVAILAACASAPAPSPVIAKVQVPPPVVAPAPAPQAPAVSLPPEPGYVSARQGQPFSVWLATLRQDAVRRGISAKTLDEALTNLEPNPRVIELDRNQSDVKASYFAYMRKRLTGEKIARAQAAYETNKEQLLSAQTAHGVPAEVIVGIWGMETDFGGFSGNLPVIQSLASLAYDGRRSAMFREELIAALTMLDKGDASLAQMRGSWAGAFGQSQFMPSSYLRYAVDGDGSGNRDIWKSLPDVFGSIGNYLKQVGWNKNDSWGLAVVVPAGFNVATVANPAEPDRCKPALRKHSISKPISDWKALGFLPNGTRDWPANDAMATLVQPDGAEGPAFLTLPNFRTILNYNCSNFYALSVLLLADAAAQ